MDKFYIITNEMKDPSLETTKFVQEYLQNQGKTCFVREKQDESLPHSYKYTDAALVPEDVDCVLVLGGDGTLLQASRDLVDRELPMLGVNLGTLGYLAEINKSGIRPALDRLIEDKYNIGRRMMIKGVAIHKNKRIMSDIALNDIVIGRYGRLRVIDFNIYVNQEFLNSYSADGVIISTPTGSTGYSLSAGGPIVSPEASLIMITPIAPHTLNTRSIVLPDDVEITIEVGAGHSTPQEGAEASFDGDSTVRLECGDQIVVTKSERYARMVKINQVSFLEVLRKKMSEQ